MSERRLLFVSLTNDIGSDRLVSDLGRAGAVCAVLGPPGSYASEVRCVTRRFAMPPRAHGLGAPFVLARRLARACEEWDPDRVVPLDDLSATLLRTLARKSPETSRLGRLLRHSFGAPAGYETACGRVALMDAAARCGVRVPRFAAADSPHLRELALPVMVKRDQSSGSGGVVRIDDRRGLTTALRSARLKGIAKRHLARLAGLGRPATPVLVQSVVEGRLAMYTAVSVAGTVIDGAGFEAVETHPTKGSSTILRHCPHPEMAEAARRLVAALGCSGFVSFDFILDGAERAFLIEMNPRPIGSAHLGRRFGHDLAQAFLTGAAASGEAPCGDPADIALFPKELERDPTGHRLDGSGIVHDVPHHEPAVIAAYLRKLQAEHPAYAAQLAARCGTAGQDQTPTRLPHLEPELC